MNKLCKVPHKRKFHEAPCHKPDSEKVIIIGNAIDSKKLTTGKVEIAKLETELNNDKVLEKMKQYDNIQSFFLL